MEVNKSTASLTATRSASVIFAVYISGGSAIGKGTMAGLGEIINFQMLEIDF
jgi:hypothetical protein